MGKDKIYKLLSEQGLNFIMIAEALGVTKQAVYQVINSGKGSRRIAEAVARACNRPLDDVFPFYAQKQDREQEKHKLQAQLNNKLKQLI